MKVTKQDIGGELLSIITKGMYADPKDALREYIQNGVDALAQKISVKVRHNSITITDDGKGMAQGIMRKAVRVGISEKNPKRSVGFMGIGVYSSFHLCNTLNIYSRIKDGQAHMLSFDFSSMKSSLDRQKERKLTLTSRKEFIQIDLLTLLEKNITFKEIADKDFPSEGTRVEMIGIEPNFFKSLAKEEEVAEYLERVLPLPFSDEFTWGKQIYDRIQKVCEKHKTTFRTIELGLDLNGFERPLFRPYRDIDFKSGEQSKSLEPIFHEMKSNDGFLGIAWGCLNASRRTITNGKVRGFIVKKQGFTIGKRDDILQYFGRTTYFNRYVGEFIAVHPLLYPNGPRTDFEYSNIRSTFYSELKRIADAFNDHADNYQETEKAKEDLYEAIEEYNMITKQIDFFKDQSDKLLIWFASVTDISKVLETKYKAGKFEEDKSLKLIAKKTITQFKELNELIRHHLDSRKSKKNEKKGKKKFIKQINVKTHEPKISNLSDLIGFIGLEFTDDMKDVFDIIDDLFIKGTSKGKDDYEKRLVELRKEIESLFDSE